MYIKEIGLRLKKIIGMTIISATIALYLIEKDKYSVITMLGLVKENPMFCLGSLLIIVVGMILFLSGDCDHKTWIESEEIEFEGEKGRVYMCERCDKRVLVVKD